MYTKELSDLIGVIFMLGILMIFMGWIFGSAAPYVIGAVGTVLLIASLRTMVRGVIGLLVSFPCLAFALFLLYLSYHLYSIGWGL